MSGKNVQFALRDSDVGKLLECRECSVVVNRLQIRRPFIKPRSSPLSTMNRPKLKRCFVRLERLDSADVDFNPKENAGSSDEDDDVIGPSPSADDTQFKSFKKRKSVTFKSQPEELDGMGLSPIKGASENRVILTQAKLERRTSSAAKSAITSFYEYPTMLEPTTLNFSSDDDPLFPSEKREAKLQFVHQNRSKAPTFKEVTERLSDSGIYSTRPVDKSLVYGCKEDADKDPGVDVGVQKIKVPWSRDLPQFRSESTEHGLDALAEKQPRSDYVTLQMVKKAPTRASVGLNDEVKLPVEMDLDNLEDPELAANQTARIRIRKGSGDSDGSSAMSASCSSSSSESFVLSPELSPEPSKFSIPKDNPTSSLVSMINDRQRHRSSASDDIVNSSQMEENKGETKRSSSQLSFGPVDGRSSNMSYQNLQRVKKATSKVVSIFTEHIMARFPVKQKI